MHTSFLFILGFVLAAGMVHCQVNTYPISRSNRESDTTYLTNDSYSKFIHTASYAQLREVILTEMKNDSTYTAKVHFEIYCSEKENFTLVGIKTDLKLKEKVIEQITKNFTLMVNESIEKDPKWFNSLIIIPMHFHLQN